MIEETNSFVIKLRYDENAPPVSKEGKLGHYIGSGNGTIVGKAFEGDIHFTLFESQGDKLCQSNLFGVITTKDGAEINFDSVGIFKVPDSKKYHEWITTAGVHFETKDKRYDWLNSSLGTWNGTFDMKKYLHKYILQLH